MFERFRIARRERRRNREIVERIFAELVRLSRDAFLYGECGVPDTVMGRFEAISLHVYLFLRRCREADALAPIAQDVVDRFMTEIEASIRELGVGDPSVPKRMRMLAGMFYERVAAYEAALEEDDGGEALANALVGRVLPKESGRDAAARLSAYMRGLTARFSACDTDAIRSGRFNP